MNRRRFFQAMVGAPLLTKPAAVWPDGLVIRGGVITASRIGCIKASTIIGTISAGAIYVRPENIRVN
jgi:hypothetical protein